MAPVARASRSAVHPALACGLLQFHQPGSRASSPHGPTIAESIPLVLAPDGVLPERSQRLK